MKPKLLIVTEDIAKIQTFTGYFGNLYSFLCQVLLKIKLNLTVFAYKSRFDITILSTEKLSFTKPVKNITYSEVLDLDKTAKYKKQVWKLTNKMSAAITQASPSFLKNNSIPLIALWQNKIAGQLIYHYFSYLELFNRLIAFKKYPNVLVIGNSHQELIARFLANKHQLKMINYSLINLNYLTSKLEIFFRLRELNKKFTLFKSQTSNFTTTKKLIKNPVLLSADFFRHLKTLVPIYKKLNDLKAKPLFITEDPLLKSHLKNFKLTQANSIFLANYVTLNQYNLSLEKWQNKIKSIRSQIKSTLLKKPNNLDQLITNLFFKELSPIIDKGLLLSKLYLVAGENLIKTLNPKTLVVAADVRLSEVTLSYLAKVHKIPSVTTSPRTMIFKEEVYQYNLTDYISVAGQHARKQLLSLKVPSKKIIINGDPRYDHFDYLEKNFSKQEAFKKLNIKPSKKKIVLLISDRPSSHLPKEEKQAIFIQVSEAVKNQPNSLLVIKPHPTEKQYRLKEELGQWGITNAIISDNHRIELFDLLKLSSVVIIAWSMTGLEAMMLKKPVIIVNPHQKDYDKHIPYLKNKAVVQSYTSATLTEYLNIYTNPHHPKTKKLIKLGTKFSEYYIQKPDGQVAQRISKLILKTS